MTEKTLTQAAFAAVLAFLVTLPLLTYGCLRLKQEPADAAGDASAVKTQKPAAQQPPPGTPGK